jgi:hypothetical protein
LIVCPTIVSQPIIILGAARSGTKYLRDILATAPNAAKVPYDINYVWRYGSEAHPDDALPLSLLSERKRRFIRDQVHRLAKAAPGDDMVVIEKTVGSTLRVPFAAAVFPEAKFVHLIRDGRAVTESAMRQWQEPLDYRRLMEKLRGLPLRNAGYAVWFAGNLLRGFAAGRGGGKVWVPLYPGLEADVEAGRDLVEICARQWQVSVETTLEGLAALMPERQIELRYEDLVSGTEALQEVAEFCRLKEIGSVLGAHARRVDAQADRKWEHALSEGEKQQMMRVAGPTLQRLGYGQTGGRDD